MSRSPATRPVRSELAAGIVLTAGSILMLVAAGLPDPRVFASGDPTQELRAIAARPWGWTAQALLFPLAFATVAGGFWLTASRVLPAPHPARRVAQAAALVSSAAVLLWLPISQSRLQTGSMVTTLLSWPPEAAVKLFREPTFWPYTIAALLSTGTLAAALAWGGVRRRTGSAVALLATCGLTAMPLLGDWPPFATYLIVLALGSALLIRRRTGLPPIEEGEGIH
jgi:hypothetical protein